MSVSQEWEQFLRDNREAFIGGEIEHQENPEGVFRGPIVDIAIVDNTLTITTEWIAHMPLLNGFPAGGWSVAENRPFQYTIDDDLLSPPRDIGEGRVIFQSPFSLISLFPQDGSKLDPQRVQGL